MFIGEKVFQKLTQIYDASIVAAKDSTEDSLSRVLTAKDSEVQSIVEVKNEQIAFLNAEVEKLRQAVAHERVRAEAAIDRLLENEVRVAAVRNADIERDIAERDSQAPRSPVLSNGREAELKKIFAEVNSVLSDEGQEDPMERLVSVGGQPV